MPRKVRIELPEGIYHVTQHGIDEKPIFRRERDNALFLEYLADELRRSQWTCLGYALMRTHYHLLVRLTKPALSSGFQRLNSRYAQSFNRMYGRRGHVFERRFRDTFVESEGHRFEVTRYIHLNPVRAHVCTQPEDYVWSDYAGTMGFVAPDPLVDARRALAHFGDDLAQARVAYRRYVEERDVRVRRGLTRV